MTTPRTLFEKIWDAHVVAEDAGAPGGALRRSPPGPRGDLAAGLRRAARARPRACGGPTARSRRWTTRRRRCRAASRCADAAGARRSCAQLAGELRRVRDPAATRSDSAEQGIVHVIGPELGLTQPGTTIVCGDSHTSTHGAFGALAFGIGTSEVEHVLATQCLLQRRPQDAARSASTARCRRASRAKDIDPRADRADRRRRRDRPRHRVRAATAIRALDMEGRMTVCNMSIEAGARAGMIAPDDTTFAYLEGRAARAAAAPRGTRRSRAGASCAATTARAFDRDGRRSTRPRSSR